VNRIDRAFEKARGEKRAALIAFISCGDPDLDTSVELIPALEAAGADVIEFGIPHSDPIGEGPTIQKSSQRALARGATTARILQCVKRARDRSQVPLVLMGYLNNALAYGYAQFAHDAAAAGADGLILSDVPYESTAELDTACEAQGVHRVLLVAPTTTPERAIHIAKRSRGFVYCVSVTGVTGARRELPIDLEQAVARLRRQTSTPIGVGFGISTPEQAAQVARFADGVIVGSALVDRIGSAKSPREAIETASEFVRALRSGLTPRTL
jgi:tryptophan synthase alpha chain